jgi:hypothetical protein
VSALYAILSDAARKERGPPVIDAEPQPAEPAPALAPKREFDPETGKLLRTVLAPPPPAESASRLLGQEVPVDGPEPLEPVYPDLPNSPRMTATARQALERAGVTIPRPEPDRTFSAATTRPGHPAQFNDRVVQLPDRYNRRGPRR